MPGECVVRFEDEYPHRGPESFRRQPPGAVNTAMADRRRVSGQEQGLIGFQAMFIYRRESRHVFQEQNKIAVSEQC